MIKLRGWGHADGGAPTPRNPHPGKKAEVQLDVQIEGGDTLSEDARNRITLLLQREAERIAVIASVDLRDQEVAVAEAKRIKALDPNRSHVVLGAGFRDPVTGAIVTKGTVELGPEKRKFTAVPPGQEPGMKGVVDPRTQGGKR